MYNNDMKFNTNFGAVSNPAPLSPQKKPVVVCCIPGKEFTPGFFDSHPSQYKAPGTHSAEEESCGIL
jgi:hypothetical protein